jgi:hypothetical protein
MQPTFLGKITVASAGTPVPLSTDATIRACTILVATIPGLTGNVYFGGAALNQSTLAGVMIKFNAPAVLGQPDYFILQTQDGRNSLRVSDYFIDASVSGEGALVTYFQT